MTEHQATSSIQAEAPRSGEPALASNKFSSPSFRSNHKIKALVFSPDKAITKSPNRHKFSFNYPSSRSIISPSESPSKKTLTPEGIEQILATLKPQHEKLLEDYSDTFALISKEKQLSILNKENKQIRDELKRINEFMSFLVDYRRITALVMKHDKKEVPSEVNEQEYRNFERQLKYMEAEYSQYKERVDQISDPQYTTELKERIVTLTHKMKKLEKRKKRMETNQKKKDKDIIKKVEIEPELSQNVVLLTSEVSALDQKLKELDMKLGKNANSLQEQSAKLTAAKEHWKKVSEEATGLSIETGLSKEENKSGKKTPYEEAAAKKAALEKTVNLLKTRYTVTLGEYTQKKIQLQNQVTNMAENIQRKNDLWIKRKEELTELVNTIMTIMKDYPGEGKKTLKGRKVRQEPALLSQQNLEKLNSLFIGPEKEGLNGLDYNTAIECARIKENILAKRIQKTWKKHSSMKKPGMGKKQVKGEEIPEEIVGA